MKPALSITPEREAVALDDQRVFSPRQKARIFERAGGRCEVMLNEEGTPIPPTVPIPSTAVRCNRKIRGTWIAGHYPIPHWMGGPTKVENGRVECVQCADYTKANDATTAAKSKRISGQTGQRARYEKRGGPSFQSKNELGGEGYRRKKAWAERNVR